MRVLAIVTAILLLVMAFLPLLTLSDGGIDPRVPADLYNEDKFHPVVGFLNDSFEVGDEKTLTIEVSLIDQSSSNSAPIEVR